MKKILSVLCLLFVSFLFIGSVSASGVSVSANKSTVAVGSNVTFTFTVSSDAAAWDFSVNYDSSRLTLVSSTLESGMRSVSTKEAHGRSYTATFKAKASGSASVNINTATLYDSNETVLGASKGSKAITIKTQAEIQASYSSNNNLKGLSIEGVELTPTFDSNTLEYSVTLPPETTSMKVNATVSDSRASVKGAGDVALTEGMNKIEVTVTAENGNVKTYIINAQVNELDPIEVKINDSDYTVIRKADLLVAPSSYTASTTTINDNEVPSLTSDITGIVLVGLKDVDGNINLYIYKDDEYTKYVELKNASITIMPLSGNDLSGYIKTTCTINDQTVDCYKINEDATTAVIYGLDLEKNEERYFKVDLENNTFIRYDEDDTFSKDLKFYTYATYIACGTCGLVLILLIISLISKGKKIKVANKIIAMKEHELALKKQEEEASKTKKKKNNA